MNARSTQRKLAPNERERLQLPRTPTLKRGENQKNNLPQMDADGRQIRGRKFYLRGSAEICG
jgi:hypothetical protein